MPALPSPTYPRLISLTIHGGYLSSLTIHFAPHVTCLIGGKGCGKTTAFEIIRYTVAAKSLAPKDSVRPLLKKNLGAGFARVDWESAHGVRYYSERGLDDPAPRYFTADGVPVKLAPDVFPIEAYGQDEIERVGENRASQLGLIDRLSGEALRSLVAEIAAVTLQLEEGAAVLLKLEVEITALESDASEAQAIAEQLKPLLSGTGPDAQIVTHAHAAKGLRGREKQSLTSASAALLETRKATETFATSLRAKLAAAIPPEVQRGANGALFARVLHELASVTGALEELTANVAQRAEAANAVVSAERDQLAASHATQDAEYDALLSLQKEDQARIDDRARLQERHAVVAGAVSQLEEKTTAHARLRAERDALAERLVELRDLRSAVRTQVKETHEAQLEADGVRIRVEQDKQLEAYRAYLREVLQPVTGNQPKWLVEKIAPHIRPDELVAIVRAQDTARLIARADLKKHPDRAMQVIAALTPNAHLYALQSIAIDDEVIIETRHGSVWKDTVECSPGQRAGAILPILLLDGDCPLLIDQPDDNVDPDFMCNAILPRVAAMQGKRQFVFVTHHANVPVLSGAQQIALIASDGLSAHLEADGGVEPMKGWIVSKLEGGEGAFEARRRAYEPSMR